MAEAVVIGGGFIGTEVARRTGARVLGRADGDLTDPATRLGTAVDGHTVIFAASTVPVTGSDDPAFAANLAMLRPLTEAAPARVVYLSTDAVYPFDVTVTEATAPAPASAYAEMHLAREVALRERFGDALLVLRVSQVYGPGDRHNAYGPMRMLRAALATGEITLFGEGEERRDHLHVEDAAQAIAALAGSDATGILNLATGRSVTFAWLAREIAGLTGARVVTAERRVPVTHRDIDIAALGGALPGFAPRPPESGLRQTLERITAHV